jgi:hypothetical protein
VGVIGQGRDWDEHPLNFPLRVIIHNKINFVEFYKNHFNLYIFQSLPNITNKILNIGAAQAILSPSFTPPPKKIN